MGLTFVPAAGALGQPAAATKVLIVKRVDVTAPGGPTLNVPLSFYQTWKSQILDETINSLVLAVPTSSIDTLRVDAQAFARSVEIRPDFDQLDLRTFPLDLHAPEPSWPAGYSRSALPDPLRDTYVIQFRGILRPEWLDSVRVGGGVIVDYVPQNGLVILIDQSSLATLTKHLPLQLVRLLQPAQKISQAVRLSTEPFADVNIVVLNVPEAVLVLDLLHQATLSEPLPPENAGSRSIYRVTVATSALAELAALPAVVWIEEQPTAHPSGEREVHLVAGDTLVQSPGGVLQPAPGDYKSWLTTKSIRGSISFDYRTVVIGQLDTGWNNGAGSQHPDLQDDANANQVTSINYTVHDQAGPNNDCVGHGTMVAGELAGNAGGPYSTTTRDGSNGNEYLMGLGSAPGAHILNGRVFNYLSQSPWQNYPFDPQGYRDIYGDLVASRGAALVNMSYNENRTDYTTNSMLLDMLVRHAAGTANPSPDSAPPVAIFCSAGNTDDPRQVRQSYRQRPQPRT